MAIGAHEGQKVHGTFREHFSYLQDALTQAVQAGAATPEEYMGTLLQLLKAVEALRLKNEAALLELEKQKAYHQAAVSVCSMMSQLVLNIVDSRTRERLRIMEGYKNIQWKTLLEDKERLSALKGTGKDKEAAELEADIAQREAELRASVELGLGSEKEIEITKQAVAETQNILGGILSNVPPNPRTKESHALQEVVAESLKAVPVNEAQVVLREEKAKEEKKKPGRKSKK